MGVTTAALHIFATEEISRSRSGIFLNLGVSNRTVQFLLITVPLPDNTEQSTMLGFYFSVMPYLLLIIGLLIKNYY